VAERSEVIRSDIERTRAEMGDTMDALGYKANVPARSKGWMGRKRQAMTSAGGAGFSKLSGAADSLVGKVSGTAPSTSDLQGGAGRLRDTAERNPLGLAVAGAAVGFLAGLFAPSTTVENEKLGPIADQAKSSAVEAGQEALDRGKQVAQAAGEAAVDIVQDQAQQQGQELSASVHEKARDIGRSSR
jgi:gas vesicle protein